MNIRQRALGKPPEHGYGHLRQAQLVPQGQFRQAEDRRVLKNSRMFAARWVANTTRGTNDYIDCRTAIYLGTNI